MTGGLRWELSEKQLLDALAKGDSAWPGFIAPVAVQLRLHLSWKRREQQNPISDPHCLWNRVGDKQHGEARSLPQL
jgi:hypothetical protein